MEDRLIELLKYAIKKEVSDIHFTLSKKQFSIEMRTKGEMKKVKTKENDYKLIAYLKYRSNLDLGEGMKPQSGAFTQYIGNNIVSLRFSCVTSFLQTSAVLRILNVKSNLTLSDIAGKEDEAFLREIIEKRSGLVLFCGPTGSGKTTSLYTLLHEVDKRKIFSLEDPIEIIQEDIVQIQINEKAGLSYDEGIKQLLRQDPDIIMIGEIRGVSEAIMAVRAALTGHLVVSTIHASSIPQCIERLLELSVSKTQLNDVILAIINQRIYPGKKFLKKEVVMEIADRKCCQNYLNNGVYTNEKSLKYQLEKLVEENKLTASQAKADLD